VAFNSGFEAVINVNSNDISAYTEKVQVDVKRNDQKLPRLGANQVARLVGPAETEIKLEGWVDPALTAVLFPLAVDSPPTLVPISYQPEGAAGTDTRTGNGYVLDYMEETDAKDPAKWSATIVVNGDWA